MKNGAAEYNGIITSEVRVQLTDLVHTLLRAYAGKVPVLRRVCSITVELLDNAQRYGADGQVRFGWKLDDGIVIIRTENVATADEAARLVERVRLVRGLRPEELEAAYRAQLVHGAFGAKGGAGLGIMGIARMAEGSLSATAVPISATHSLCITEITTNLNAPWNP